jgi:CRP/FNR family transcriptional regulator, cyclic AMP receptor protein
VKSQIRTHTETEVEPLSTRVALHPFLAGMNHTHLALLTDCAVARHFDANQKILGEGEFANGFYLIETGKVALGSEAGSGEFIPIKILGAGDLLGWSWMFPPYVRQFTARAIEPVTALFIYAAIVREYCEKDHSLGYELLKRISAVMVTRLQAAHDQMLSLHSNKRVGELLMAGLPSPATTPISVYGPAAAGSKGQGRQRSGHRSGFE